MKPYKRPDSRAPDQLRAVRMRRNYLDHAEGSCLVEFGRTRVLCAASVEDRPQPWLKGTGRGWVTAEYSMLPRATRDRTQREVNRGRPGGRTHEIQRLIGRSLRSVVNLKALGERTVTVDCDCIVADAGTRTASITGGFIALYDAMRHMQEQMIIDELPITDHVAAVSVGIINGLPCLDLDFDEDSRAEVDMNVVMTGSGEFVEVQGTAEGKPFSRPALDEMLVVATAGISELVTLQKAVLDE
ncbi:MAG TPA: ribonuclease PH [Actinomycetota bacterium]|nr:ribonuclease PH [Actinomycetota bacterium]